MSQMHSTSVINMCVCVCVCVYLCIIMGLPWLVSGEESACHAGNAGLIPGLARSPRERNGNPFQYSCLGNHLRGSW